MNAAARFITLEGIDGAGKSSHAAFIADRIRAAGHPVKITREPGGTPLGERVRELVLGESSDARTTAMLMFAARSAHLASVIEPALRSGTWVLCDRFTDSTFAYQCGGQGLSAAVFESLQASLRPSREPDATFLFDLDPAIARSRREARSGTADAFEREKLDFAVRVREAYLQRALREPGRVRVIDASGALEAVRASLAAALGEVLE